MQDSEVEYYREPEESLHLFRVLAKAYKAIAELSALDSKSHGLNPTEFAVMEFLFHKGPQPLQKIGSSLLLQSGGVTYVIDKLEKGGMLERKPCPHDRRVTYASLTTKGNHMMTRIFPLHARTLQEAMSGLTIQEKQTAAELLKKLGLYAERKKTRLSREWNTNTPGK